MKDVEIVYQDKYLLVVNKPAGMLVHRTDLDPFETVFLLQILRNRLNQHLYPIHRLDKPTSGALVFAFDEEIARTLTETLQAGLWKKDYFAVVRGWFPDTLTVDRGIRYSQDKPRKPAVTHFTCLSKVEVNQPVGRYETARYSLIQAQPETGRRHQIRKHLNHCSHPIIGDSWYGDRFHNRFISELVGKEQLYLHAGSLVLPHPVSGENIHCVAPFPFHWQQLADQLGITLPD